MSDFTFTAFIPSGLFLVFILSLAPDWSLAPVIHLGPWLSDALRQRGAELVMGFGCPARFSSVPPTDRYPVAPPHTVRAHGPGWPVQHPLLVAEPGSEVNVPPSEANQSPTSGLFRSH